MKIAVCDDEVIFRDSIKQLLKEYYKNDLDLIIDEFSSGEELIESYLSDNVYDIVFLDIEMKELDGISTAKRIRIFNNKEIILFLTSHLEYAIDGYEVNAFRFLEKPINKEKLISALQNIEKLILEKKSILLHTSEADIVLPINDIVYFESIRNDVYIYAYVKTNTVNKIKEYRVRKNLKDFSKELEKEHFFKCHRSYIINLDYVRSYENNKINLENEITIPLSRGKYKLLKEKLITRINNFGLI